MNKFQKGDPVKVISGICKGKDAVVDYFNGSKYCVSFDQSWEGYFYPEELEHFDLKAYKISQIEEKLGRIEDKLDMILAERS